MYLRMYTRKVIKRNSIGKIHTFVDKIKWRKYLFDVEILPIC